MKTLISFLAFCFSFSFIIAQENVNRQAKAPVSHWSISNNYSKSDNGQLVINLPGQAALAVVVKPVGATKTFALRNASAKELPPGSYDITFWGIKIPGVVVEKRKDTRIHAGILHSTVKGTWEVWTIDGIKVYTSGGPKQVALPVGDYILKTKGAEIKTAINDGKISIFSFTNY